MPPNYRGVNITKRKLDTLLEKIEDRRTMLLKRKLHVTEDHELNRLYEHADRIVRVLKD